MGDDYPGTRTRIRARVQPIRDVADESRRESRQLDALRDFLRSHCRLTVLTGAGCSTGSGIPDYRDSGGVWKRAAPIQYQDFINEEAARRRYWARSLLGWPQFRAARPNDAHRALASLEQAGAVHHVITQNVDGLHQQAGSQRVVELHGTLSHVECVACRARLDRVDLQPQLESLNPEFAAQTARLAPDGDVQLDGQCIEDFRIPGCPQCGGVLKPTVVFFGESVPPETVGQAGARVAQADGLLVVGSSLMVYSGYRFVREALRRGQPVAIINRGRTRADAEVELKADGECGALLQALARDCQPPDVG